MEFQCNFNDREKVNSPSNFYYVHGTVRALVTLDEVAGWSKKTSDGTPDKFLNDPENTFVR